MTTARAPDSSTCVHASANVAFLQDLFAHSTGRLEHHTVPNRFYLLHHEMPSLNIPALPALTSDAQSSRLSVLTGLLGRPRWSDNARAAAKALVYNLDHYSEQTHYGPFLHCSSAHREDRGEYVSWPMLEGRLSSLVSIVCADVASSYHDRLRIQCVRPAFTCVRSMADGNLDMRCTPNKAMWRTSAPSRVDWPTLAHSQCLG